MTTSSSFSSKMLNNSAGTKRFSPVSNNSRKKREKRENKKI